MLRWPLQDKVTGKSMGVRGVDQSVADDIWAFVLRLYARPGVPAACLDLQDRFDIDVPLLMFACWLGLRGTTLDSELAARARDVITPWHREIVCTLRRVRQRLKTGPAPSPSPATEALRDGVKRVELESERLELTTLAAMAQDWSTGSMVSVAANLAEMFTAMTGQRLDPPGLSLIAQATLECAA